MADSSRAQLDALLNATDAQLAALLIPVAKALGIALTRAQDRRGGTIASQRLPMLRALLDDLIARVFGTEPAAQFDGAGKALTPIARLVGASTRAATRLALAPTVADIARRTQGDPQLQLALLSGRQGLTPPPGARVPRVDSSRTWVDPNGYTLSDRLWQNGQETRDAIDALLQYHIGQGADAVTTGKALENFLTPAGRVQATRTPYGTSGIAVPRRLARTESSRAYAVATQEGARRNPWVIGLQYRLSGNHPKQDQCDSYASADPHGMGTGIYRIGEIPLPPVHPNCRCVASPHIAPNSAAVVADLGRWTRGEDVPALRDLPGDGIDVETLVGTLTGIGK